MPGRLEVIRGCMFSGKTEELCRRVERLKYAGQKYLAFKPYIDNRYAEDRIVSHTGYSIPAVRVKVHEDILDYVIEKQDVVAIDEVQFFTTHIVRCINVLIDTGYRVIIAGLDTNYKGDVFGYMGELLAIADEDVHLKAVCAICGGEASRTQLLVNEKPASHNEPAILIGGGHNFDVCGKKYKYQARCRTCYVFDPDC